LVDKIQQDGRKSFFAALGGLLSYVILLILGSNNLFGRAFLATFGVVSSLVAYLFPLLSLFGCVAGFVYGASSWRTHLGKYGITISLVDFALLALLFWGVIPI